MEKGHARWKEVNIDKNTNQGKRYHKGIKWHNWGLCSQHCHYPIVSLNDTIGAVQSTQSTGYQMGGKGCIIGGQWVTKIVGKDEIGDREMIHPHKL